MGNFAGADSYIIDSIKCIIQVRVQCRFCCHQINICQADDVDVEGGNIRCSVGGITCKVCLVDHGFIGYKRSCGGSISYPRITWENPPIMVGYPSSAHSVVQSWVNC